MPLFTLVGQKYFSGADLKELCTDFVQQQHEIGNSSLALYTTTDETEHTFRIGFVNPHVRIRPIAGGNSFDRFMWYLGFVVEQFTWPGVKRDTSDQAAFSRLAFELAPCMFGKQFEFLVDPDIVVVDPTQHLAVRRAPLRVT